MRKFFIAETNPRGAGPIYPHVTARIEVECDGDRTDMELLAMVAGMISTGNMMQVTRVEIDKERTRDYDASIFASMDQPGAKLVQPNLDRIAAEILTSDERD
jgi:hypothetical protein